MYLIRLALVLTLIGLSGCSGSGRLRYDTPEEAFDKGKEYFDTEKYSRAVEYFQGTFDFGRTHAYAADAQFLMARSYHLKGDYLLAANEYQRFMQLYRADPRVEEAEFEYAMTLYERAPKYERDQTDTRRAVDQFQVFIDRYPTSERVATADSLIRIQREKLALKQFEGAKLYEKRELFEAAALTFDSVFDRYPDTSWSDDALLGSIRNLIQFSRVSVDYKRGERYQEAYEHYQTLVQIFPDSPVTAEAKRLIEENASLASE